MAVTTTMHRALAAIALSAVIAVPVFLFMPTEGHASARAPSRIPPPIGRALRVAVVGDSITGRGSFASTVEKAWANQFDSRLAQDGPITRMNATMHRDAQGNTTLGTVDAVPADSDVVLFGLGTNDAREVTSTGAPVYSYGTIYSSAAAVLDKVRAASPTAVLICLGVWQPVSYRQTRVDALIAEQCHRRGGQYIAVADLYEVTSYRLPIGVPAFGGYTTDGFHPNDAGHTALARRALIAQGY